jgi:hypothetical protein
MSILRVRDTKILNSKSARSLLSTFFVSAARALLCEWRLELGGVGIYMTAKIAEYFRSEPNFTCFRARILRQSKLNGYIIIDRKLGDDYRS